MKNILRCVAVAGCVALTGAPAAAQGVQRTLWLDAAEIDLADPKAVAKALDQPVQRLVVSCFVGGETVFPTQSRLFPQMAAYRGKDVLRPFLAQAAARGKKVYAYLDCLHWTLPDTPKDRDLFHHNPDLAEVTRHGSTGGVAFGKYASPFHREVRRALQALAEEVADRYPELAGLVLRCGLSRHNLLGYSRAARGAFYRDRRIDLRKAHGVEEAPGSALGRDWGLWRAVQVAALVRELADAARSRNGGLKVAALGDADFSQLPPAERNKSVEDCLTWALAGSVDELLLLCAVGQPTNKEGYAHCLAELAGAGRKVPVALVLPLSKGGPVLDPGETLKEVRGYPVTGVVLHVQRAHELDSAARYLKHTFPEIEPVLPRADLQRLETDPRLQKPLTLGLRAPRLRPLLRLLQSETAVPLTLDEAFNSDEAVFGSWSLGNVPAWKALQRLALAEKVAGHWEPHGEGYRLVLPPSAPSAGPTVNALHWLLAINVLLCVALGSVWLLRRRRRGAGGTALAAAVSPGQARPPE